MHYKQNQDEIECLITLQMFYSGCHIKPEDLEIHGHISVRCPSGLSHNTSECTLMDRGQLLLEQKNFLIL